MAKDKNIFICSSCGHQSSRWVGKCPNCNEWNTLEESIVTNAQAKSLLLLDDYEVKILANVPANDLDRLKLESEEINTAMGGGLVPAQVALIAGEPGVGKSTLLLQIAAELSAKLKVLYVAGEESAVQISGRAKRLGLKIEDNLLIINATNWDTLLAHLLSVKPQMVVFDSIQTLYSESVTGSPGSISQTKYITAEIVNYCKKNGVIGFCVGHINKSGSIAGPKAVEHLVDTVLYFEGEEEGSLRYLRASKNRFGPVGEVAILQMTSGGIFDAELNHAIGDVQDTGVGSVWGVSWEGTRPLKVQIQALVQNTVYPYPKRVVEGMNANRVQLLIAVLEKHTGANLANKDVYVRVHNGYKLQSPICDLAIVAAILSSLNNIASNQKVYAGTVSLSGQVSIPANLSSKILKLASKSELVMPSSKGSKLKELV